jgi:hypothetical protein
MASLACDGRTNAPRTVSPSNDRCFLGSRIFDTEINRRKMRLKPKRAVEETDPPKSEPKEPARTNVVNHMNALRAGIKAGA